MVKQLAGPFDRLRVPSGTPIDPVRPVGRPISRLPVEQARVSVRQTRLKAREPEARAGGRLCPPARVVGREDTIEYKLSKMLAAALTVTAVTGASAAEPKHGGVLKIHHRETPGGLSIHEEATFSTNVPMMPVFNNLVIYDQHKPQNSLDTIVPDLATSWSWNADKTQLTFRLRDGVKWHLLSCVPDPAFPLAVPSPEHQRGYCNEDITESERAYTPSGTLRSGSRGKQSVCGPILQGSL